MRPLEALIAVVAALCALNVSAVNSSLYNCTDELRENYSTDGATEVHLVCGRQMHGKDPLIWLGGNRTNFLIIECLKQPAENYTCEDIPEFDFGHNDTIKEVSFLDCPMTFVSIACLERRLGVREALKLTVHRPQDDFQWLREDMERLRGFRWISFGHKEEEVTITSAALAPMSALERLDLTFMKPRLAPGALAVLRALTHLQLTFASLRDSYLPGVLANLPALTDLDLSHNYLEIITHDTFQNLTSLERLDLSGNKISSLDGAVLAAGCPRLRELKAQFNPLVELRPLEDLQHLVKLDISNCYQQKHHLELLPRALSALPQLAHIDVNSCKVHTLPEDLLVGSKSLLTVNLSDNQLSALPQSLFSDQRMLQELNLGYNKLETLPQEIFSSLMGLQRLDIRYNHLRALPARLFTNQRVLQDVNFSGNKLETLPEDLFSVDFQHLNLENKLLKTLPEHFLKGLSVHTMDLSRNPMNCDCHLIDLVQRLREPKHYGALPRINLITDCIGPPSMYCV